MRGTTRLWATLSTLPVLTLCAACTTLYVDPDTSRLCSRYTDLFLDPTAHAAAPADKTSKEWVNFGIAEAGQLNLANHDKSQAKTVLHMCEDETKAANARAARKLKPWYKRIF